MVWRDAVDPWDGLVTRQLLLRALGAVEERPTLRIDKRKSASRV